ncbi:MAG: alpha-amylase, partial [Pseudomonadota bacterium]|nr:alpha-amylase [Pseudomonadota bacterium]
WRQSLDRGQSMFALHNVSKDEIALPSHHLNLIEDDTWVDILTGEHLAMMDGTITLAPYQCRWITNVN